MKTNVPPNDTTPLFYTSSGETIRKEKKKKEGGLYAGGGGGLPYRGKNQKGGDREGGGWERHLMAMLTLTIMKKIKGRKRGRGRKVQKRKSVTAKNS